MAVERHFLDWDRPLGAQAAAWLLARAEGHAGCPDLGAVLVLVPTAEAGRILKQELLRLSPRAALLPPDVRTPAQWLPGECEAIAGPAERLLAWREVLLEADLEALPALLPHPPVHRDAAWAAELAGMLEGVQEALREGGWRMEDVARRGEALREPERWEDLARLEALWLRKLRQMGLQSPCEAWRQFASAPALPAGVERVVLAGVPDPIPWTLRVLEGVERVDVLVHAPEAEQGTFDVWGRPRAEAWAGRELTWQADEAHLHVRVDESSVARRAAALVRAHQRPGAVVLGLAREALGPVMREVLPQVHDPAGRPARQHEVWAWFDALAQWLERGTLAALVGLLRHPAGAAAWAARGAPAAGVALAALDRFRQQHLARTEEDLRAIEPWEKGDHAVLRALATATEAWRNDLEQSGWLNSLAAMADAAWKEQPLDEEGARLLEVFFTQIARQARHGRVLLRTRPSDHLALACATLGGLRLPVLCPEAAIEMKGWLELGWEARPHLILVGLQEGDVPYERLGDVFLPDSLRAELGLRSAAGLQARDTYLFQVLAAQRRAAGRLDVLVAKFTDAGEPLLPSRLIFLCSDAELPQRAQRLFSPMREDAGASAPAPTPPRRLRLPPVPVEKGNERRISVTDFAQYLESPLLFYLSRRLGWEAVEPHKQEMDALDFGTLAHRVLEQLGREEQFRDLVDAKKLAAFLRDRLDEAARRQFGLKMPLGVEVQLDALARRLERFAEVQAREASAGWRIEAVERKFEWVMEGWTVTGKIDRIDRHADGRVRLLDYKTSEKPQAPEAVHYKVVRGETEGRVPRAALFTWDGKALRWTNLQLLLYAAYWAQACPEDAGKISCGYVQLPRMLQAVELVLWAEGLAELAEQATACAQRILQDLAEGSPGPALLADCWKQEPWASWMPGGPQKWIEGQKE